MKETFGGQNAKTSNDESLEFIEYDESAAYPGTLSFEIKKLDKKDE
jgi:hypothetical protein